MNNQEIIVPFDLEQMKSGMKIILFVLGFFSFFFYLSRYLHPLLGHYITFFIQSILAIFIIMLLISLVYIIFLDKNDTIAARLNQDGVWVREFGFISWVEIDTLFSFTYGTPLEYIGIRVKNLKKLSKQASLSGKMKIFWSKIFGYPPIIIAHAQMDNEQILAFSHKFISPQETNDTHA